MKSNEFITESKKRCMQCGMINCPCAPGKCDCNPVAGWIPNKGFQKTAKQDVTEGSQRVDSLVTDALRVMKGPEVSDAILALKRVLGDRAYNERRGFYRFYIDQIHDMYGQQDVSEEWSQKYKSSINCSHPKGFSQKAHCAGKKKHNESVEMEMVCEDCGMCRTHGNHMMETAERLDAKCWTGMHKAGTKIKGGVRVNNCVPNESVEQDVDESNVFTNARMNAIKAGKDMFKVNGKTYKVTGDTSDEREATYESLGLDEQFDMIEHMVEQLAEAHGVDAEQIWEDFESVDDHELLDESAAWHRKAGKNPKGGLNRKGVASYRAEHPGSHLQMAVTTKPSKLKAGSKAAKRRKSFCARMGGVKGPMKKPNGKPTRKALALRKWNC